MGCTAVPEGPAEGFVCISHISLLASCVFALSYTQVCALCVRVWQCAGVLVMLQKVVHLLEILVALEACVTLVTLCYIYSSAELWCRLCCATRAC